MHRSVIGRTRSAIIGLLLLLATWRNNDSCDGLQYQPVEVYANGDDCALILSGPGRTSVFDYTYNLLRGSFPATAGSQTCITYDAVNRAYIEARKRINVAQPKSKMWRPEDLATVGELLLDISSNLAQTYGLTFEEIEKSLPLIDTSKTLIRDVCPAFLSNVECRAGKYRRNDGLCTNLQNPTWGSTLSPFQRLMSPRFADGLTAPRISETGHDLPLSRVVSRTMHPDEGYHDHAGTVMVIAWGQFMDHDYTLTGTPLDPLNRNDPEECCHRPQHLKNPYCNEIHIPEDDYFYRLFGVKCMDFVRAFPAVRPGCRLGSRVPFNLLTGVLDGNTVYGISESFARKLRAGYGGLLRMNPVFSEYGLKDLLPLKLDIPDEGCTRPNRSMYCFEAGEIRVNEQLVLTCMHTLMAREHNRIAKTLIQINPHWDDETLYQEARRIVIALIQHITYNEFLPILLGKDVMEKFGLLLEKNVYWDGYDESVNPAVIDAFAAAAFRFGHSLLPTAVERWSKAHKFIASKRLSDLIRRPFDLYRAGVFDEYVMGLMNQVAQAMDDSITQEVTNHLFKKVGAKFGLDLVSFNMQRGREFGIPSYMEFRKFCGLPWADTFDELHGSMPNETIKRYSSIFDRPADVDLWSGGVSERPLPGSMLGPTFACIIATQFSYSRRGDRFWYELPNQPSSFTLDQLNEIRKVQLARVICDNTDLIDTIQLYPMVLPDHEINPRVPCRSGVLPSMDLSKWAEFPTANQAQYTAETGSTSGRIESLFTAWKPITKIENATGLSKKMNKNSSKRISSITSPLRDGKINKHSTINTFTKPANNASINILNTTELKSDSNSNLLVEDKVARSIKFNKTTSKNKVEIFETLNNRREWDTIERVKRSLDKKSNYVGFREQVPSLKRFYRHPGLSYEEQQNQLDHTVQTSNINQNLGSAMNKLPETTIEYPSKEPSKHSYVPIFPSCDDTENFESNDSDNSTKKNVRNRSNDKVDFAETQEAKGLKTDRNVLNETFQDTNKLQSSVRQQRKDNSYIDIRDHQKSVENVTSSAIAEYNPNKIPYVEVPDYSDIREESLDERDRKENETRTDFVDPEVFADLKESAKSSNDSSEGSVKDKSRKNSRENLSKERESDLTNLDKFSDTDESDADKSKESNSNFTNSDKSSKTDKQDTNNGNKSLEDLGLRQNSDIKDNTKPETLIGSKESSELSKNDELEENDKKNLFKDSKDDLNNANLKKLEWKENARGGNGEPQEDSEETGQGDSESKSGPIIFDINEYRKPFDLDEFLKDDPIMKKLNLLEKETRTKYGQNGKRVSTDFNESESDNTFRERANGRGNSKEIRDTFDDLPRSYKSSDFADMFAKIDEGNQNEGNKGKKGTESDNQESEEFNEENSDDDFLTIFKKDKEDFLSKFEKEEHQDNESEAKEKTKNDNVKGEDSVEENSNEDSLIIFKQNKIYPLTKFENEKVFPSGYLKNEQNNRNVVDRRRKNNKYQEDRHDALSTILSKKSQVSRLDEDIDGRIEDGDAYKNFWSLEYKSPRPRVDMEAQERRK